MGDLSINDAIKVYTKFLNDSGFRPEIEGLQLSHVFFQIYYSVSSLGILPRSCKNNGTKSSKGSERFRSAGNADFGKGNFMAALENYTRAIGKAFLNSAEIALAYGNRSAVTFQLGEFNDSLIDIGRAIDGGYPDNKVYKLYERKGNCFLALEDTNNAICAFESALSSLQFSNLDSSKALKIQKCLEDKITKAIQNSEMYFNGKEQVKSNGFTLSHAPSSCIECASEALRLEHSNEMGRMVVANVDIYPGDVLAIEKPYASILLPEEYTLFCNFCLKRCHSSIPCSHCDRVFFCNEACRDFSWKQSHEIECSIFPTLISLECDKMELLAVHTLVLMTDKGNNLPDNYMYYASLENDKKNLDRSIRGFHYGKYLSDRVETAYFLETNEDKRKLPNMVRKTVTAAFIFDVLKASKFFDASLNDHKLQKLKDILPGVKLTLLDITVGGLLLNFLLVNPCNAHMLSEMRVTRIGTKNHTESPGIGAGLFNFLSLINHSCDPNVVRTSLSGNYVALTAIKPIKKDEQIFDNYGFHFAVHDLSARVEILSYQYYFSCRCRACDENWPLHRNLPSTGKLLPEANFNDLKPLLDKFVSVAKEIASGDSEHVPFLCRLLTKIDETYDKPNKVFNECQEAIKECLGYQGNCYLINHKL